MNMKKNLTATLVIASLMFMSGASIASAESTTTPTGDIATLQAKVEMLMKLIESLKASIASQKTTMTAMRGDLQLAKRQLHLGDSGDDVKVLQETLATDPAIYPEGLITGKFGPLTAKAVKRFQEKQGLEGVGEVGPKTREILNRFLMEGGAGKSGKIPEGLLRNMENTLVVHFSAQNNSGLKGMAMIKDNADGKAVVRIRLEHGDDMMKGDNHLSGDAMMATGTMSQPAHIHVGSCPTPGAVKYPLSSVVDGKSETVLTVSTKDILAGLPLSINVHKSADEIGVYLACGDITAPAMMKSREHEGSMMMKREEHKNEHGMKREGGDEHGMMMGSTTAPSATTTVN